MQENTTIARPYARAVFEQAQEEGDLQEWSVMLQLLKLIVSDPAMQSVIKNPRLEREKLAELILDICGKHLTESGRNFVNLLVDAGRISVAPQIHALFEEKKDRAEGVAGVEVISAYPLDDNQQEKIKKIMAKRLGKKIDITTRIDKSLIGGAVIRAGDSVIDASLKGRLKQLSHNFAE
ncbi:MAG: H(+)-transporting two-sector ATPase [Gammaproteobacteria bacterium]|nr:H(+)-transporting two-sector ATPase [Gammaproteobacteria bacterium]